MSDETPPPPEETPAAAPAVRCINWHRMRVYFWSILICCALWGGAMLVEIRLHPQRVVDQMLAQLPYPSSTGGAKWVNRRTLQIDNVKVGGFFYADTVVITASPFGLWRRHIAKVQVIGGQLYTKEFYAAMEKAGPSTRKSIDWVIGRLEISRGTILLDHIIADTSIPVRLGVRHPLVLNALRLGKPDASPEMTQEQTIELGAVSIVSPVDPLAPVFYFPLTRITFTYEEFWHHKIRRIEMIRPTMFLGEDLFWLTKQLKAEKPTATQGLEAPWQVERFKVDYGRLAVNAFGQPVFHFPFFFNTRVDNIRLDQLDQISAKSTVNIEKLSQDYPDYKVRVNNLRGKLYFSWPPSDAKANNVVNTIDIDEVSWNDIAAQKVSITVTFDPNGIYGRLYGTCEGGQLSGNFEFYYTKGFTWNADFFASKVNCQPITQKLAGRYADLTGELDGKIAVQGKVTEILSCVGALDLPNPGVLQIKSLKDLLDRLPPDTIALKRQAMQLAISSLETYPYQSGQLRLNYTVEGGTGTLKLDGPRGSRNFEVYLHPYNLSDAAK